MTLPASYPISMSQINTELGRASNATTSLTESAVRTLAGVPSGAISFGNLLGKSSLSASGVNDFRSYSTTAAAGTASAFPSVNRSGGTGSYTYSWSFTSNPQGASLSNSTSQTPTVSMSFAKNSTGGFSAVLQCVVTSGGSSVTVSNINAGADWEP